MAVDTDKKPTSSFEATEKNGLTLILRYSLPFDLFVKGSKFKIAFGGNTGSFDTKVQDFEASFCVFNGAMTLPFNDTVKRHCFLNLGALEIANEHEWDGRKPHPIKNNYGDNARVVDQERDMWAIATMDQALGERVTFGSTHAPRNELATVQTRMGMVLEQARRLAAPYETEIRANYKANKVSPTDDDKAMVDELRELWEAGKPEWETDWK